VTKVGFCECGSVEWPEEDALLGYKFGCCDRSYYGNLDVTVLRSFAEG
jgi:hypothetical protein